MKTTNHDKSKTIQYSPVGKIAKNSLKECMFVNSALKMQCHAVKNTLLQTAFSVSWEWTGTNLESEMT